jgi:choline kinase
MNYERKRAPVAVILAAGLGAGLSPLTDKCPKSLLTVGGSFLIERMMRNCLSCGIAQFVLVLGHRADEVRKFVDKTFRGVRVTYVINPRYQDTGSGYSLMLAAAAVGTSEFIKFDADVVFDVKILRRLVDHEMSDVLCIDSHATLDVKVATDVQMQVLEIGRALDPTLAQGEYIGIEKISAKTGPLLFAELAQMMEHKAHLRDDDETAYVRLVDKEVVFQALDVTGLDWTGIQTVEDFERANKMFDTPITTMSRGQQRALDEAADAATKV